MNQRFYRFSFYFGLFILSSFFAKEGLRPHEKVLQILFYSGLFIFSSFFRRTREKGGLNKGPKAPNEPKVLQILFYSGLFIFSSFFRGTREKGVSLKEGLRPP